MGLASRPSTYGRRCKPGWRLPSCRSCVSYARIREAEALVADPSLDRHVAGDRRKETERPRARRELAEQVRLSELADSRVRYGYRRLTVLLKWEGWEVDAKRISRLCAEEGLSGRTKKRKERAQGSALRPDKPVEKGYVESFNGKLREERLNVEVLFNLVDACRKLQFWRCTGRGVSGVRRTGFETR